MPLLYVPLKNWIKYLPVHFQLLLQYLEWVHLVGAEKALVSVERGIHVPSREVEAVPMLFGVARIWFQEIVSDISSGQINISADLFQRIISSQKIPTDRFVATLDLSHDAHGVEPRTSHEQQEAAKSGPQCRSRIQPHVPLRGACAVRTRSRRIAFPFILSDIPGASLNLIFSHPAFGAAQLLEDFGTTTIAAVYESLSGLA
jgi:hypothetical protein